jgi:hypothetical protein
MLFLTLQPNAIWVDSVTVTPSVVVVLPATWALALPTRLTRLTMANAVIKRVLEKVGVMKIPFQIEVMNGCIFFQSRPMGLCGSEHRLGLNQATSSVSADIGAIQYGSRLKCW